jgi:hypothetical protein
MKRLYIAVILLSCISLSSFAGSPAGATSGNNNTTHVSNAPRFVGIENFNKTFPQAVITDYKSKGDLTEVNFMWNGLQLMAFYSREGELVATSRTIDFTSLPVTAQLKLKADYSDYFPRQAIEFDAADSGSSYYVSVVNAKTTLLLHVTADGMISVFKKMSN